MIIFAVIPPAGPLRSHILTVESADAETMSVLASSLLDGRTFIAATEFTAPW